MKLFFKGKSKRARSAKPNPWACHLLAAALLPVLAALLLAVGALLRRLAGAPVPLWPALAGAGGYLAFQWLFQRPMAVYVFGHELSHALAAWISGYRVKSFSASSRGGEVVLSGSNVWVALAPYCVPIYTVLAMPAFSLARHAAGLRIPAFWWSFVIGATFAFHAALTVHALRQNQPDLRYVGAFLSLTLIFLANGLVFALVLKALFPAGVSLKYFAARWAGHLLIFLDTLLRWAAQGAQTLFPGTGT